MVDSQAQDTYRFLGVAATRAAMAKVQTKRTDVGQHTPSLITARREPSAPSWARPSRRHLGPSLRQRLPSPRRRPQRRQPLPGIGRPRPVGTTYSPSASMSPTAAMRTSAWQLSGSTRPTTQRHTRRNRMANVPRPTTTRPASGRQALQRMHSRARLRPVLLLLALTLPQARAAERRAPSDLCFLFANITEWGP